MVARDTPSHAHPIAGMMNLRRTSTELADEQKKCVTFICLLRFTSMADFLTDTFFRIRTRLERRARGVLHDSGQVEDALQEAFVRLWGRYPIGSESEAEALLMRTVRNVAIDESRKHKPQPLNGDIPTEEENPAWQRELRFLQLEDHISRHLSDIQQYIIRRHEFEGATLKKVARELGMQAPAVRMQLSRARKTLRAYYQHEQE